MTEPSPDALLVACIAFCDAARREQLSRNPNTECPVPAFLNMDLASKRSMMKVMQAAFRAAKPDNVALVIERLRDAS